MKHNGIEYSAKPYGDVVIYDGGAMGGQIKCMPNGRYEARWSGGLHATFAEAADSAQKHERGNYERYRKFVMQYEKESKT